MGILVPGRQVEGEYKGVYAEWEPLLTALRNSLAKEGYQSKPDWWIGLKNIDEGNRFKERPVLMEIAHGDGYAERMAKSVWELFEARRTELEGII